MRYFVCAAAAAVLLAPFVNAQGLTARELYYRDDTAGDAIPAKKSTGKSAVRKTAARAKPVAKKDDGVRIAVEKPPVVTAPTGASPHVPPPESSPQVTTPDGGAVVTASAVHFGVRYNVMQVTDRAAKMRKPVDPDTAFHTGDCVAIDLTANRDGFLYVFNQGTTGAWQVLLPSADMPDQTNAIRRGRTQVVPGSYCFEFDGNPGSEKLLVVLTERDEDARSLGEAIRSGQSPDAPAEAPRLLALNRQIEMLRDGQLIGRDIKIAKMGTDVSEGEPEHSVYAVKASSGPSERLVLEIDLRHE